MIWNADPVLFAFAGLKIHWYGALFATAIIAGLQLMKWIYVRENHALEALDSLLSYTVIGIIVGARLGHCLFYDPQFYFNNPLKILAIWEGGLASHGGGLGVIIASYFYAKKHQMNYLWLLDKLAIATALFGFFVRLGNFVNSEIIGTVTKVSWAVVFSRIDALPRHPVQLYEALSYLTIFVILVTLYKKSSSKQTGGILGVFLCLVFTARFLLEFIKQKQAAYTTDILLSTGQMLSIPFLLVGIGLAVNAVIKTRRRGNNL
jgi:phosphatidylglycerol:prolipoprotein diacylglycerol transferase